MHRWILIIALLAALCGAGRGGPVVGSSLKADTSCNLMRNYVLEGGDLKTLTGITSAEACCQACKDRPACATFTWGREGSYCDLKMRAGWKLIPFCGPVASGCVRDCYMNGFLKQGAAFNDPRRWANMGGFDGKRFLCMGEADTWDVLLENKALKFQLRNKWYAPPESDPDECVLQHAFHLRNGSTTAKVELVWGRNGPWRIKLYLNGRTIPTNWTTPVKPPVFVSVKQAKGGAAGEAIFDTGFARIIMTQPWFWKEDVPGGWMDVMIQIRQLPTPKFLPPVHGILGPSYIAALKKAGGGAGGGAAAGTLVLSASAGKIPLSACASAAGPAFDPRRQQEEQQQRQRQAELLHSQAAQSAALLSSSDSDTELEPAGGADAASAPDAAPNLLAVIAGSDGYKEESRQFRRTVFDFRSWHQHRSTSRYLRHASSLPRSRVVWGLAQPLAYVLAVSLGVCLYHEGADAGLLPVLWPDSNLAQGNAFGLSSFALSLLLVFRTNSSYSRWLDARKAWAVVSARSKDFARQALTYIPSEQAPLQAAACRWLCAFSLSLMCSLREGSDLEREVEGVLLPHEADALLAARNRPAYALQVLSRVIGVADLPLERRSTANIMDQALTQLQESMATCNRILSSPIPLSYTRHTSRYMMIWLTVLPFILWDTYHWVLCPICGLVAFLLLGIEEIGVSIEEPFSILPLESICSELEETVRELHATHCGGSGGGVLGGGEPRPAGAALPPPSAAAIIGMAMELPARFPGGGTAADSWLGASGSAAADDSFDCSDAGTSAVADSGVDSGDDSDAGESGAD